MRSSRLERLRERLARQRKGFLAGSVIAIGGAAALAGTVLPTSKLPTSEPQAMIEAEALVPGNPATDSEVAESTDRAAMPGVHAVAAPAQGTPTPRVAKPDHVRGIYVNFWAAASSRKLAKLIDIADRTEVNAFVIDVKEGGEILYRSQVPLAREIGADKGYVKDPRALLARLKEHGIYPIARIVVFRDPVLAQAKPQFAIQKADGSIWKDNKGKFWVDTFNREVWDYNIALAREAIQLGFSEVQWDYVRFPDVPRAYMNTAVWPAQAGRTKENAVREFLLYSRERLADLNVPVTADVFGLTVSASDDMGIGQRWEKMADATDVLLPMVYPSHFARGSYGIAHPNSRPYEIVKTAMEYALRRSAGIHGAARIRPWLQDFTLGPPRYGPAHVRAQIQAVYDAGLTEWILWHPGSNYSVGALASADGTAPQLGLPPSGGSPPAVAETRRSEPRQRGPKLLGKPVPGTEPPGGGGS